MTDFLNYIIESSVLLLILGATYFILMRNDKQFNFRRFFILGGLVFCLLAPFMHLDLGNSLRGYSSIDNNSLLPSILPDMTIKEGQLFNFGSVIDFKTLIILLYSSISVFLLIRLILQFRKLRELYTSNPSVKDSKGKSIIVKVKEIDCAFNFMNLIFISKSPFLNEVEHEKILSHERVHAQHLHTIDNIFLQVLSIFFWFHPIVWLFKKEAVNVHEYIADREVMKEGVEDEYISLISKITLQSNGLYLANHFSKSSTINRISMLTSKTKNSSKTKSILSICIIFTFGLLFSCNDEIGSNNEVEVESIKPVNDTEEVFNVVDNTAAPKTSFKELYQSLGSKIQYPEEARKMGIEGRVMIEFIIEKDGSTSNHKILKGISPDCDNEALRVVKEMDNWNPGSQRGIVVRQKFILPVTFTLSE